jgi:nicotinamidase-related amidase
MIPRMNMVLDLARELGMLVIHAPTDVANFYAGWEQRERMSALPQVLIPGLDLTTWPSEELMSKLPEPLYWEGDMCGGPFDCKPNYGEYKLHLDLVIGQGDWISASGQDVYNLCMEKGIENLIYMGGATNFCLVRKPDGMINMEAAGLRCLIARDLNQAYSVADDSSGLDKNTDAVEERINVKSTVH